MYIFYIISGKISSNEIGLAIERIIDSLGIGGVAVLLPCLSFKYFLNKLNITSVGPSFSIVKRAFNAKFSIFLYIYWGHFVGFVIKKCDINFSRDHGSHGCFDHKVQSLFDNVDNAEIKLYANHSAAEQFLRVYQSALAVNSTFSLEVKQEGNSGEWQYRFEHFTEAMKWFKGIDNRTTS